MVTDMPGAARRRVSGPPPAETASVLFLCRANVCRSPMAAALLSRRLDELGIRAKVASAATASPGMGASAATIAVMASRGIDLSGHRGMPMTTAALHEAEIVIVVSRECLDAAIAMAPSAAGRVFVFADLVRRAQRTTPRQRSESMTDWLRRIGGGGAQRSRTLAGAATADDVPDPRGRGYGAYEAAAELLSGLVESLIAACWSSG